MCPDPSRTCVKDNESSLEFFERKGQTDISFIKVGVIYSLIERAYAGEEAVMQKRTGAYRWRGVKKWGFCCVCTVWITPYSKFLCRFFTWKPNHMHMSDQRVMKMLQLKVNCLEISNFLDHNLSLVLFLELVLILVKSDGIEELWYVWNFYLTNENRSALKNKNKSNLLLFYYK